VPIVRPDIVKRHREIVQRMDAPGPAAVITAIAAECGRTGALVLAEGIETAAHRRAAAACGAHLGMTAEPARGAHGARGAALAPHHPLRGEWSVAVLGPHFAAALVAVERPGSREFDHPVTYDRRQVVRATTSLLRQGARSARGAGRPRATAEGYAIERHPTVGADDAPGRKRRRHHLRGVVAPSA
jgi:hypothetical protein